MARRTGLRTIRELAFRMCQLVGAFTPIIKRVYPDSIALHTALDTANAACSLLVAEADDVLPIGD